MTQELFDLRVSILEGRYADALAIVDELDGMSKQAILRNIASYLVRLLIHLVKNQLEQRLTNSWIASISESVIEIKLLNLKGNKTSYYIAADEWQTHIEEAIERAIRPASIEVLGGRLKPFELAQRLDRAALISIAQTLLSLTYSHSIKELPAAIDRTLAQLSGGAEWFDFTSESDD